MGYTLKLCDYNTHRKDKNMEEQYSKIIHTSLDKYGSVIQFPSNCLENLKKYVVTLEKTHGFDVSARGYLSYNSYDCDDYLYVSYLVQLVFDSYNRMNFIPESGQWRNGYKEVPYIHVELYEGNAVKLDELGNIVFDDKKLGIKVNGPDDKGYYTLYMDCNYLLRYILFLQQIFDDNQELFFDFANLEITFGDGRKGYAAEYMKSNEKVSRNDVLTAALQLQSSGLEKPGKALEKYALSLNGDEMVFMPAPTFWENTETGENQFIGFTFYDEDKQRNVIQLKKRIFNNTIWQTINLVQLDEYSFSA